jgi:hypothetical protein
MKMRAVVGGVLVVLVALNAAAATVPVNLQLAMNGMTDAPRLGQALQLVQNTPQPMPGTYRNAHTT